MHKVLIAVDGSPNSLRAVEFAISLAKDVGRVHLHVVYVQPPIQSGIVHQFISNKEISAYYADEADKALRGARELLEKAQVQAEVSYVVGHIAEALVDTAARRNADHIVMGTRGLGAVQGLILGSIATKVVHLSTVPVTLVK